MSQLGFSSGSNTQVLYLGYVAGQQARSTGEHGRSKRCLYINRLEDINIAVLGALDKQANLAGKQTRADVSANR